MVPRVEASLEAGAVIIVVHDDGPGFNPEQASHSGRLGLDFLRERIRLIGGRFSLQTSPGAGTTVRAALPIDATGS